MRFVGVDPGLTGGIALLNHDASRVKTWPMPIITLRTGGRTRREVDGRALCLLVEDILTSYDDNTLVSIEQVHSSPQMGVTSAFNFGAAYATVKIAFEFHSMCDENLVRVENVTPAVWKRQMRVTADKDGCRARAQQLWPRSYEEFKQVKNDGRAEAALIAEAGRLLFLQREGRAL